MNNPAILVADDDPEVLNYLETALLCHKYPVIAAQDGGEALSLLAEHKDRVSVVVLDVMMPCKDGIETLLEVRRLYPELPVVMLSGASDPDRIVEAMKAGAQEFLIKPIVHEKLLDTVRKTLSGRPAPQPPPQNREQDLANVPPVSYVMLNPRMRAISDALRKTAAWNVPVVLRGESGVGKEVLARELHRLSPRANKEFVKINCVALPSELLESELFGYERGAFTGAFKAKPGKFELADGGTILLDEIGDMDLKLQAKLLQVLQDGEFHRLGGKEPVRVDVRVLVATHCDLEKAIDEGAFREDLYYRLNVVSITVPPLRERRDEILPLAEHFFEKHSQADLETPGLTDELKRAFLTYDWPGNVRELENVVRRYLVFEDPHRLSVELHSGRSLGQARRLAAESYAAHTAAVPEQIAGRAPQATTPAERAAMPPPRAPHPDSENGYRNGKPAGQPLGRLSGEPFETLSSEYPERPSEELPERVTPLYANSSTNGAAWAAKPLLDQVAPAVTNGTGASGDQHWASRLDKLESLLARLVADPPAKAAAPPQNGANGHTLTTLEELDEQRNQAETRAILSALEITEWNRKKAAKLLNTDYKALLYRMKKLGIGERNDEA
jgi:DNA-binding NtrC family response regulator